MLLEPKLLWVSVRAAMARVLSIVAGAAAIAFFASPVSAAPPPVADFFKPAAFAGVRLSPSGKQVAVTVPASNDRQALAIVDIADPTKTKVIVAYKNYDVAGVQWINDERLVWGLADMRETFANQPPSGLFSIDAQGKEQPRMLIQPGWLFPAETTGTRISQRALLPNHFLMRMLRDGSDDVIIGKAIFENNGDISTVNAFRLNTRDGSLHNLSEGAPGRIDGWLIDNQGRPQFVETEDKGIARLYWKASDKAAWVKIDEGEANTTGIFMPIAVDSGNRVFAMGRLAPETDVVSVGTMQVTPGTPLKVEALLTTPGFDAPGDVVLSRSNKALGVAYHTEGYGTYWFDATMKKVQEQVDAARPSTNNLLDCGDCENIRYVLVTSYSDRLPAAYAIFDVTTNKLEPLAASRPWIKPQEMAATDFTRIRARDGLEFPVYVTRPKGEKAAAPMVVLVHGGPFLRGVSWGWRNEAQFLASRGYVVVEPEMRGSMGYGNKLFRAGWKQWGLKMQDDIADAALWAIKQGYADPKRVCIMGGSYGGYATFMGLIRNPEIFRCGVEIAGVSDIDLMYSINWSDFSSEYKNYGMPVLVGDRVKDAEQLAATSPLRLASKITQPLFMAHGSDDLRVPIEHGRKMYDSVRKTNPNVEFKVYDDEGHGLHLPANRIDYYTRVETFLDKYLKNTPAGAGGQ